jgi:hypothetical protein
MGHAVRPAKRGFLGVLVQIDGHSDIMDTTLYPVYVMNGMRAVDVYLSGDTECK